MTRPNFVSPLPHEGYRRYLPSAYDSSMSIYEELTIIHEYLGKVINAQNELIGWTDENLKIMYKNIADMMKEIERFEGDVIDKLVPESLVVILNEWYANGKLAEIINKGVFDMKADTDYVNEMDGKLGDRINLVESQSLSGRLALGKTWLHAHATKFGFNNTIPAFEFLASHGDYQSMEADIHVTRDNVWVCTHDDDLALNTNGSGLLHEMTYDSIQAFDVTKGGNNLQKFPRMKIPKLIEFIHICKDKQIVPIMEIKCDMDEEKTASLVKLIKDEGIENNCIIMSFNKNHLNMLRKISPVATIWIVPGTADIDDADIQYAYEVGNCGLGVHQTYVSKQQIDKTKARNVFVFIWGIEFQFQYDNMNRLGANILGADNVLRGKQL